MTDKQHSQPQPIPFSSNVGMEQEQGSMPPSMDRFPSTSQFNQQMARHPSMASINYNDEQQLVEGQSQKPIESFNQLKELNEQVLQQQEELQKVNLEKNLIDQDQILRMFQEEQMKRSEPKVRQQRQSSKKQPNPSQPSTFKRTSSAHQSLKKQASSFAEQGQSRKRHHPNQSTLPESLPSFHAKSSSIKDIKPLSAYAMISSSEVIKQLVLQYKIQYRAGIYEPEWQRERYRLKEQLFEQLCIGVMEIKEKKEDDLLPKEKQLMEKLKQMEQILKPYSVKFPCEVFKLCRCLALQLDLELFIHFHQKSKQPLNKDYKTQYKLLLTNLKDPQNQELRRKLLVKQMDAQTIKTSKEVDFWTQTKRNEAKEKEEKLLMEFSVERERGMGIIGKDTMLAEGQNNGGKEQGIRQQRKSSVTNPLNDVTTYNDPQLGHSLSSQSQQNQSGQNFNLSTLLASNKYLDESTLTQLQELLSSSQLQRMRTRLQEDLRGETRQKLLRKFDELF